MKETVHVFKFEARATDLPLQNGTDISGLVCFEPPWYKESDIGLKDNEKILVFNFDQIKNMKFSIYL